MYVCLQTWIWTINYKQKPNTILNKNEKNNLNNGKYYVKRNGYISLKNNEKRNAVEQQKKIYMYNTNYNEITEK